MALDIYRRQARNLAWYDQDGEVPSHNPFKKFRRTPKRRASIQMEEQGASPNSTNDAPLSGGQQPEKDIGSPEASGAVPPTQSESPINTRVDENGRPRNRKEGGFLAKFKGSSEEQEPDDSKPVEDEKPKFTVASQIRATVLNSWINILIVAAPVGSMWICLRCVMRRADETVALHVIHANPIAIFVVNFIAIM